MTIVASLRSDRVPRTIRFVGMVLVALLLAHVALFAAAYGVGSGMAQAMSLGGHDGWWTQYLLGVLGIAASLAGGSLWRIRRLARSAADLVPGAAGASAGDYTRELVRLWRTLFPSVTILLVVQENIEHAAAGGPVVGLEPVASPLALLVIGFASLAVSFVGALARCRIRALETRLIAARRCRWPRVALDPLPDRWWLVGVALRHSRLLDRNDPGRAPPLCVLGR